MKCITDSIWNYGCVVIPTNGIVKSDKKAVMGAGVAYTALQKFPGVDIVLGKNINYHGNVSSFLGEWDGILLFSMPTKNHYKEKSSISLIQQSAVKLCDIVDTMKINETIALPVVGCGLGGLNWENDVCPILSEIFDDRFLICLLP